MLGVDGSRKGIERKEDRQKNRRKNSRPAVDGSDPSHINEADYHQRKKIRYNNEGRTEPTLNRKLSSAISVPEDHSKKARIGYCVKQKG